MKKLLCIRSGALALWFGAAFLLATGAATLPAAGSGSTVSRVARFTEPITPEEQAALLYMREEEKLARDVYRVFQEKWNLPIFGNIAEAEQHHMDAIAGLLTAYQLTDPVGQNGPGVFHDAAVQKLYASFVAEGMQSSEAALRIGARIEELDIADLLQREAQTGKDNILTVFGQLRRASRNHLRAFVGQLDSRGADYVPQHLSALQFNTIIEAPHEPGGPAQDKDSANQCCSGTGKAAKGCCGRQQKGKGKNCRRQQ